MFVLFCFEGNTLRSISLMMKNMKRKKTSMLFWANPNALSQVKMMIVALALKLVIILTKNALKSLASQN